jgi:inner membrane protein
MTSRTHDLAAFTALNLAIISSPITEMSLSTAFVSLGVCFLGGLAPDLDKPTSGFWDKIPAGSFLGKIVHPFLGGHRLISHSFLGFFLFGWLFNYLLILTSQTLIVNMEIVWYSFMIGYLSHLIVDSFTHDGVPWLFPIPIHIGFPPFKFLRLKTGGIVEKGFVFPILLLINVYLFYRFFPFYLAFIRSIIR